MPDINPLVSAQPNGLLTVDQSSALMGPPGYAEPGPLDSGPIYNSHAYQTLLSLARTFGTPEGRVKLADAFANPPRQTREARLQTAAELALNFGGIGAVKAFHGSPHEFAPEPGAPLGRFRDEAIGTGEGAQAFGYGHYVAESPGVASTYKGSRDIGTNDVTTYNGQPIHDKRGIIEKGAQDAGLSTEWQEDAISAFHHSLGDMDIAQTEFGLHGQAVDWLEKNKDKLSFVKGKDSEPSLYNVVVRPDKHELLDWDKPFREMEPDLQDKLVKIYEGFGPGNILSNKSTGEEIYRDIARRMGTTQTHAPQVGGGYQVTSANEAAASAALHEAGIPGIKFLDQQSRKGGFVVQRRERWWPEDKGWNHLDHFDTREKAEQAVKELSDPTLFEKASKRDYRIKENPKTHNLVIFHPDNIKITARNGKALTPVDHDPFAPDLRPVDHVPEFEGDAHPRVPEARRAPNGRFYALDPERPGKYVEVPH